MDNTLQSTIKQLARNNHAQCIALRRWLHMYPELSFQEWNTARYIADTLRAMDIEVQEGIAQTGLVALIKGKNPTKRTVALRADIDALPIQEANAVPYKSQHPGIMHACGHDVHTASLLGVASILQAVQDQFEGTVKLIFQPAEEKLPGGALAMIQEGVLEHPAPSSILGQHVDPTLPVGHVSFLPGVRYASCDEIYITVTGKGGHAAAPHLAIDPIVIASHLVISLQQLISRQCNPITASVLSFGKITAGEASNVIPDTVYLTGTFRSLDESWRAVAHEKIGCLVHGLVASMQGSAELKIVKGYPCLRNEVDLTFRTMKAAQAFLGACYVQDASPLLGAEDFAYYAQQLPACFYSLGVQNESQGINAYVHTNTFQVDEQALAIGPGLMAWLALQELAFAS